MPFQSVHHPPHQHHMQITKTHVVNKQKRMHTSYSIHSSRHFQEGGGEGFCLHEQISNNNLLGRKGLSLPKWTSPLNARNIRTLLAPTALCTRSPRELDRETHSPLHIKKIYFHNTPRDLRTRSGSRSYPSLSFLGTTNPTVQTSLLVPPHSRAFKSAGTTSTKIN